jgi:hypothetical protein
MRRPVEDGLSLLVGAGVGMALMYLLDPDEGRDRRENLQRAAREKLAQASSATSAGLGHLHEAVNTAAQTPAVQMLAARAAEAAKGVYDEFGHHAAAAASDAQRQARDAAQGVHSSVSGKLDELRGKATDWASDWKDSARSRYGKWLNRSTLKLGRDEDHHYVGQTACALGSLALGAGAVYLFDREQGHKRRAQLIDGATHAVLETGDFFRKAGRRLVTRGRAVARNAGEQARGAVSHLRPSTARSPSNGASSNQAQSDGPASKESREAWTGT